VQVGRAGHASYRLLQHGGGSQLRPRAGKRRIASARNHFGLLDALNAVDLVDGALSGCEERVGRGKVLFISKHARRLRRLERAIGSSRLRRNKGLCLFRRRVDGSGGQVSQGASRGSLGRAVLSRHAGGVVLLVGYLRVEMGRIERDSRAAPMAGDAVRMEGMSSVHSSCREAAASSEQQARKRGIWMLWWDVVALGGGSWSVEGHDG
jgi:hypothetical protein